MTVDPTRIDIQTDPTKRRMRGTTYHGYMDFDVPFASSVAENLWQGGCTTGLVAPDEIRHIVSLYPWERYVTHDLIVSELYVEMFDAEDQGLEQVDAIARWVNVCRDTGPVLVHCQAGLNRSSLVVARALHLGNNPNLTKGVDIIGYLRDIRSPAALCNPAFEAEVASWT